MNWEAAIGVAAPVAAVTVGYLGYRRSRAVDAVSAQSGAATESRAGTALIIDGLNQLVDQLQDDNREYRNDVRTLMARLEALSLEREECRREVARLMRQYPTAPPE